MPPLSTQLEQVNDIVSLSCLLNVEMPLPDTSRWPRLEVEFEALRDEYLEGSFEVGHVSLHSNIH
jgi:hypothetical protein